MTEILYDATREGLMKLWAEIQEDPFHPKAGLAHEIWEKLCEFEKQKSEEKLTDLHQELKSLG